MDKEASTVPSTISELDQYFSENPALRNESPSLWWKANSKRYPKLTKVARVQLCFPATSKPSERVFLTAGPTVTKLRNCLKPKNIDALIFYNNTNKIYFEPTHTLTYHPRI